MESRIRIRQQKMPPVLGRAFSETCKWFVAPGLVRYATYAREEDFIEGFISGYQPEIHDQLQDASSDRQQAFIDSCKIACKDAYQAREKLLEAKRAEDAERMRIDGFRRAIPLMTKAVEEYDAKHPPKSSSDVSPPLTYIPVGSTSSRSSGHPTPPPGYLSDGDRSASSDPETTGVSPSLSAQSGSQHRSIPPVIVLPPSQCESGGQTSPRLLQQYIASEARRITTGLDSHL